MPYFADLPDGSTAFDPSGGLTAEPWTRCRNCGARSDSGQIVLHERLVAYKPIVAVQGDHVIYEDGPQHHTAWDTKLTADGWLFRVTCLNCDESWTLPSFVRLAEEGVRDVDHGA